jgi:hypothetical protein
MKWRSNMDKYTQFNSLGEADVAASANAYAKALSAWKNEHEIPSDRIENAVETVLDRTNGKIPMPALVNFAVNELSQDPSQFKGLAARVHAYITGQKQTDANPTGRLTVTNGKGGGVTRLARPGQPVPARVAKIA